MGEDRGLETGADATWPDPPRIALGPSIAQYLGGLVPPILVCFNDSDSKVRYFACESMYNVVRPLPFYSVLGFRC